MGLVAHRLDSLVRAPALGGVDDPLGGIPVGGVERDRAPVPTPRVKRPPVSRAEVAAA